MGLNEFQQSVVQELGVKESGITNGDFWISVDANTYLSSIDRLRGDPFFYTYFVDLCGVDHLGKNPRFEVVVHLESRKKNERIRIKCSVPDSTLTIPSLVSRWTGANWQEREAYDMYGILFEGHPQMERILSAPDVTDFPQRKDYSLIGSRDPGDDL